MYQTYELYFHRDGEPPRFEPATCPSEAALITTARQGLAEHAAHSVEVWQFGAHLFTLTA